MGELEELRREADNIKDQITVCVCVYRLYSLYICMCVYTHSIFILYEYGG